MGLGETDIARLRAVVREHTFDQRFDVVGEVARGAMGRVFEAHDRITGSKVALKLLLGFADRERFVGEAEILEKLDHPAIVKYVRHGVTGAGELYLVMEWLAGETLARRLARAPLDSLEAATLGGRIAGALEAAHAIGVIHRDLKPSNVFLVDGKIELATLIDFGVAKTDRSLTRTGQIVGTPGYMAPEQIRGGRQIDGRVDLFALGCVLYEALTRRPPFAADDMIEVLARQLLETPPPIEQLAAGVPPRLARLVGDLLDKDPEHRLADATATRSELAAIRIAIAQGDTGALGSQVGGTAHGGPRTVGRYVLRDLLGTGGMGVVFAAEDPELGRPVAVKLLRPDLAAGEAAARMEQRLRREAKALAQLAHPNVVAVHDVGVHEGRIFVAMELIDGETVAKWLAARERTQREILDVFLAAGRGLAAAHAAGLVHRDFKPENVLVGGDGRVRVVDFGLARIVGQETEPPPRAFPANAATIPALLTGAAAAGTPYYMAPEQYRGEPAGARSDQFSFCVALHAALFGERPFAGDTLEALEAAVCAGKLVEPRRTRGVSRRIRAALRRGLAARSEERFPRMDALLDALAPRSRTWLRIGVPAAIALGALGVAVASRIAGGPAPCQNAAVHLDGTWDAARKTAIEAAFARAGLPYAAASFAAVTRLGDRYADDWVAMRHAACEATRVAGEQTEAVLDLRMSCLDQRLRSLAALAGELSHADATAVTHAVQSVHGLPPIDDCADVELLRRPVPPPAELALRVRVDGAEAALASVAAARDAGQYPRAYADVQRLVELTRAIGYRPLEAETLELAGELAEKLDAYADAERWYRDAELAAEAGRHDLVRTRALIASVAVVGYELHRIADADLLRQRADAALEGLGKPADLRAALLEAEGSVAARAGKLPEAQRDFAAAVAVLEPRHGKDALRLAAPLHSIGEILLHEDHPAEALPYFQRSLDIRRRELGDDHPDVAEALVSIANAQFGIAHYEDAVATYERARQLIERIYGVDHPRTARILANIARTYAWQGKNVESVELHRRALAIFERTLGPDDGQTLATLDSLASALETVDQYAEARTLLDRVLARRTATLGPDHPLIAGTLESLAVLDLDEDKLAAARDHAQAACDMYKRTLGDAYRLTAEPRTLGEALLRLGQPARAADALEVAYAGLAPTDDPASRAWIEAALGQALVDANRDVKRGRALVAGAWKVIAVDDRLAHLRPRLAAWIKSHPL